MISRYRTPPLVPQGVIWLIIYISFLLLWYVHKEKKLSTPDILNYNMFPMSFNLNANIDINKWCSIENMWSYRSTISRYHALKPCLPCIIQNSACPRFKFGYLSPVFWKIYSFSVKAVKKIYKLSTKLLPEGPRGTYIGSIFSSPCYNSYNSCAARIKYTTHP
jgi:hypothetical protein